MTCNRRLIETNKLCQLQTGSGRSEGAYIDFKVKDAELESGKYEGRS